MQIRAIKEYGPSAQQINDFDSSSHNLRGQLELMSHWLSNNTSNINHDLIEGIYNLYQNAIMRNRPHVTRYTPQWFETDQALIADLQAINNVLFSPTPDHLENLRSRSEKLRFGMYADNASPSSAALIVSGAALAFCAIFVPFIPLVLSAGIVAIGVSALIVCMIGLSAIALGVILSPGEDPVVIASKGVRNRMFTMFDSLNHEVQKNEVAELENKLKVI